MESFVWSKARHYAEAYDTSWAFIFCASNKIQGSLPIEPSAYSDFGKPTSSPEKCVGRMFKTMALFRRHSCSLKDAEECRRYSGYCAWRGVLDFSENENSDTMVSIRKAYPDLGKCLYFDLSSGDDCIAIKGGTQFLEVSQVICGPGHGIKLPDALKVSDVTFSDIHGTCSNENAIVLDCAKIGCNNITDQHNVN
ncbi:hypothetical protein RIF29_27174 [Crotalaria pallida]|uniref:Uncharacterized protein n=1 Tax=Crotalaria pallida TaxID=3830 RepID=A0AAN9I245_CROPI